GRDQTYGLSARGLAIDTAMPKGEEFPRFREFWLVRPAPEATTLVIYALLDSPSLTGAYRFRLTPGRESLLDVDALLFARADVARLGLAPLTSMYLYGENQSRRFDDFRPEVHDSDGLLVHTGAGEWIWRPLSNPRGLRVTSLLDDGPRGFGLLQRDRAFEHYLDLESRFERRPSYWIEPRGDAWGKGAVHLVEIPSAEEIHDNIVAFWVPDEPLRAGATRRLSYRLHAPLDPLAEASRLGRVVRTRIGWAAIPGAREKPPRSRRRFAVDFTGGELNSLARAQPLEVKLDVVNGSASDVDVQKLPGRRGWRVSFVLAPEGAQAVDMRLHLELRGQRLPEPWNCGGSPDELPQP